MVGCEISTAFVAVSVPFSLLRSPCKPLYLRIHRPELNQASRHVRKVSGIHMISKELKDKLSIGAGSLAITLILINRYPNICVEPSGMHRILNVALCARQARNHGAQQRARPGRPSWGGSCLGTAYQRALKHRSSGQISRHCKAPCQICRCTSSRHSRDAQVRDRETVRLAGVEMDEVAAPPAVTAVVRWAARSIMQVPTARRDAGGQRQRARRALP